MRSNLSMRLVICQIVLALTMSSCSQQEESFKNTKEHYHAADIRKVVMPLFLEYQYPTNKDAGMVIPFDKVPNEIKSLPLFSMIPTNELIVITWWGDNSGNSLAFVAGSGFGHWGLVVCRDENSREFDKISGYTYWEKGIYFYYGN